MAQANLAGPSPIGHVSFKGFHQWPFAGVWKVAEWPQDRPLPTPSGNDRKRVLGVPRCPTGPIAVRANRDSRQTLVISLGLWHAATGIVAVYFESFGAALVLFGIAGLLIRFA